MVLFGLGIKPVKMKHGVTQELRRKVRDKNLTPTEKDTSRKRLGWRQFQRRKYADGGVCSPVSKISTMRTASRARRRKTTTAST